MHVTAGEGQDIFRLLGHGVLLTNDRNRVVRIEGIRSAFRALRHYYDGGQVAHATARETLAISQE